MGLPLPAQLRLLYRMRHRAALLGCLWLGLGLPALAQVAGAPPGPAAAGKAAQGAAVLADGGAKASGAAAQQLRTSLELCAAGRLSEPALAFLTVFILVGCFVFLLQIDHRLIRHGWDIRKALSEPTSLSLVDPRNPGDGGSGPTAGLVPKVMVMEASVSRLIAMAGLIVILLFYLGFGIVSLYHYGRTCQMPADTQSVTNFLYAGLTFFAPYLVTKFSELFAPFARQLPNGNPGTPAGEDTGLREAIAALREANSRLADAGSGTGSGAGDRSGMAGGGGQGRGTNGVGGAGVGGIGGEVTRNISQASPAPPPAAQPSPSGPHPMAAPLSPPEASQAAMAVNGAAAPSASGVAVATPVSYGAARSLITEFEGFEDHAYPDPASGGAPWTIGYGFTTLNGRPVSPGATMNRQEADALLDREINAYANRLSTTIPYWREMHPDQCSALLSFAWNLGLNFYGSDGFDTISRRLREKDWAKVPDALCLYCNPGSSVQAGLLRRREAEGEVWRQGLDSLAKGRPAATATAGAASPSGSSAGASAPAKPVAAHPNPLPVPYFDQMLMSDGEGWRECFSASCGMLAKFWGKCSDQNAYNAIRRTYGDTTDAQAQVKALEHLGLDARFRMDGTLAMLKAEIDAGRPVAVGWLHHGSASAPSGGGHWTVVIGYDDTGVIMNDPYGSCDLVNGGYPGGGNPHDQIGKSDHYSYRNWLPRWQPGGSAGWFLTCQP